MELYHVLNRGVEKRDLFLEEADYVRFVHNLYEFNDTKAADNNAGHHMQYRDLRSPYIERRREKIVDIHGWCLMKNHYHLLLSDRVEGGITLFMRRLNVGYANYFNEKYERKGTLFQGRTKKVLIANHSHFLYILHYIHLNPLDYLEGSQGWRERDKETIRNVRNALEHLQIHRWSSYLDYSAQRNFPSLLTTSLFHDVFGNYEKTITEYLQERKIDELSAFYLE